MVGLDSRMSRSVYCGRFAAVSRGDGLIGAKAVGARGRGDGLIGVRAVRSWERGLPGAAMVDSREAESGSRGRFTGVSRGDGIIRVGAVGSRERGFSLLEMLVAMAVFGLVVIALLNLSGENTRTTAIVEERVLAGVVAENRAVEAMIEPVQALAGATEGSERLGDRDWHWTRTVSATDDAAIVRVEVTVTAAGSDRIAAETTLFRSAR